MCQKHRPLSVRLRRAGTQQAQASAHPPLSHLCEGSDLFGGSWRSSSSQRGEDTLRQGGSCWEEVLIINKRRGEVVEEERKTGKGKDGWCSEGQQTRRPKAFSSSIKFSKSAHELVAATSGETAPQSLVASNSPAQQ